MSWLFLVTPPKKVAVSNTCFDVGNNATRSNRRLPDLVLENMTVHVVSSSRLTTSPDRTAIDWLSKIPCLQASFDVAAAIRGKHALMAQILYDTKAASRCQCDSTRAFLAASLGFIGVACNRSDLEISYDLKNHGRWCDRAIRKRGGVIWIESLTTCGRIQRQCGLTCSQVCCNASGLLQCCTRMCHRGSRRSICPSIHRSRSPFSLSDAQPFQLCPSQHRSELTRSLLAQAEVPCDGR